MYFKLKRLLQLYLMICFVQARSLPPMKEVSSPISLLHIRRNYRDVPIPQMPMDLQTTHQPCDMDIDGVRRYIWAFPNHCVWAFNSRYVHEGYYRAYKTYQLEAFFFGQYHERMKRFEVAPHEFDYYLETE
ncbi:uncharacterized protein LOC6640609 [Drosophila willistoni]|nr:uncharacterized protein LOC6640609 [Drosophila willistoni]